MRLQSAAVCDVTHLLVCFLGLDEAAHPCAALFSFLPSLPEHRIMSPTHTPDCYFTLPNHLIVIASVRSLGMLSQFHWRHRSLFSNFCHMCRLQRWQLSSSCGDSTPQSERGGRARARLERGRATSLAAVIGQEVGCLDLRALLSRSPPTLSPPSGQSVPLRFASICPPPPHPPSLSLFTLSVYLSLWTDLIL